MGKRKTTRPRRRRVLANVLLGLVLLVLMALLLVMLLFYRPGSYLGVSERDPQRLIRNAQGFSRKTQEFVSAVWSERPFPLELTEDEINGYLAAVNDPALWERLPLKFESWRRIFTSTKLRNVQVFLREGRVTVCGEVTWAGLDVVLSLIGAPHVDNEGRVRLDVHSLRAGLVPVPSALAGELLRSIHDRPIPAKSSRWRVVSVEVKPGKVLLVGEPHSRDD